MLSHEILRVFGGAFLSPLHRRARARRTRTYTQTSSFALFLSHEMARLLLRLRCCICAHPQCDQVPVSLSRARVSLSHSLASAFAVTSPHTHNVTKYVIFHCPSTCHTCVSVSMCVSRLVCCVSQHPPCDQAMCVNFANTRRRDTTAITRVQSLFKSQVD